MLVASVPTLPKASTARTVKLLVAAVVGVPLITPVLLFMLKPAGNVPTLMLHVNGALPPLAARPLLYAAPTVALANVPLSDTAA